MRDSTESDDLTDDDELELEVQRGVLGMRLDKQLAQLLPTYSRARLQSWIESGYVQVNHQKQNRVRYAVSEGDIITVAPQPSEEDLAFSAQQIEFEVVAETQHWIVVNKPAGLVVHPGAGNWGGTLLNGLLYRFPELFDVERAGIVHRLDKETSGLMVVARTPLAQVSLTQQLQARTVSRQYLALAHGCVSPRSGRIDQPIGRDPRVAVRMTAQRPVAPKEAITDYAAVRYGRVQEDSVTELECRLHTGRTHQIRVHMASLGYPLVGDVLYGGRFMLGVHRQMLHALRLSFDDPVSGAPQSFESERPNDMLVCMNEISWV